MGVQMGAIVSIASATVTHGHTETRACRGIYFVAKKKNANCNFSLADKRVETSMQGGKQ